MSERFRQIPTSTVKEFLTQKGNARRKADRNYVAYWSKISPILETPPVLSDREEIIAKIGSGSI